MSLVLVKQGCAQRFVLWFGLMLAGLLTAGEPEKQSPLYPFCRDGKWGYIDASGAWVIQPRFGRCSEVFEGERVWVLDRKAWGCIDRAGKWLVEPRFDLPGFGSDGGAFEVVCAGKKLGILARSGQLVLPAKYDEVSLAGERAWVRAGEKLGVCDMTGQWVLKPSIQWPKGRKMPEPADGGNVAWFKGGEKWGLLSRDGKVLFAPQFAAHELGRHEAEDWDHPEGLNFKNHRAWVFDGANYLLISDEGKLLTRQPFTAVREWSEQLYVFTGEDRKEGLVSRDGEIVVPASYQEIKPLVEGRAVVVQREERVKPNGEKDSRWRYGYIDEHGQVVAAPGDYPVELVPFSEGLAPVWHNDPENAQVYDPRAGYIDRTGAMVIPESFYSTKPFTEGLGEVQERKSRPGLSAEGGLWGYVDATGALVIPPQFGSTTPFCRGRAWVLKAGARRDEAKWAMIDRTGSVLTDFGYKPPEHLIGGLPKSRWRGNLAILTRPPFYCGLATADGKVLVEPTYNLIGEFHDGVAEVIAFGQRDDQGDIKLIRSLVTEQGKILADGTYTAISDFTGGVAWASHRENDHRQPIQREGWCLIDTAAHELCEPKYVGVWWIDGHTDNHCPMFHGELAAVAVAAGYMEVNKGSHSYHKLATKGWGYMNRAGKIVAWQEKCPDL